MYVMAVVHYLVTLIYSTDDVMRTSLVFSILHTLLHLKNIRLNISSSGLLFTVSTTVRGTTFPLSSNLLLCVQDWIQNTPLW